MESARSKPVVSIVIPVRDRCELLRETLDAAFAQTFRDHEVVVVDDGSTDGTAESIAAHGDRVRLMRGARRGVAAARNRAIEQSTGRYVAFLDSDDLWLPEKLEMQVARLDDDANLAMVFTDYLTFETLADGERRRVETMEHRGAVDFAALFRKNFVGASTVVVRREVFADVGPFDTSLARGSDFEMWLRIARHHVIAQIPRILVEYRRHDASLSGTDVEGVLWTYRDVTERWMRRDPEVLDHVGLTRREYEASFYRRLAERNERFGRTDAAAEHARRAIALGNEAADVAPTRSEARASQQAALQARTRSDSNADS